jgi:hypothetical protein
VPFPVDPLWRTYDLADNAVTTILAEHALVHKGLLFSATHKFDSIASGATVYLAVTTPANVEVHFKAALIVTDAEKVLVTVTEGAAYSGGSQVSTFNRNRNSTNAAAATVMTGVTGVSGGTAIDVDYLGGGASAGPKATAIGTEVAGVTEWALKPSTNYVISVRNDGASAASVIIKLIWYEVRR